MLIIITLILMVFKNLLYLIQKLFKYVNSKDESKIIFCFVNTKFSYFNV